MMRVHRPRSHLLHIPLLPRQAAAHEPRLAQPGILIQQLLLDLDLGSGKEGPREERTEGREKQGGRREWSHMHRVIPLQGSLTHLCVPQLGEGDAGEDDSTAGSVRKVQPLTDLRPGGVEEGRGEGEWGEYILRSWSKALLTSSPPTLHPSP
jgi:hypothetical protein